MSSVYSKHPSSPLFSLFFSYLLSDKTQSDRTLCAVGPASPKKGGRTNTDSGYRGGHLVPPVQTPLTTPAIGIVCSPLTTPSIGSCTPHTLLSSGKSAHSRYGRFVPCGAGKFPPQRKRKAHGTELPKRNSLWKNRRKPCKLKEKEPVSPSRYAGTRQERIALHGTH